jgi:hypothetical protein
MRSIRILGPALVLGLLAGILVGTQPGCDDVDKTFDCAAVCNKVEECVTDLDHDQCVDSCKDWADENQDNADRLDDCHDCLDDHSCVGSAFQCVAQCAFIPTT